MFALPAALLGVMALWLAWQLHRESRKRKTARANYFSEVEPLFDHINKQLQPTGFPRLTATTGKNAFDLQALPDSLTFRKLPALWVMVSLPQTLPVKATLDIMTRPTGNEPFSHFSKLPHAMACPAFLPEGTGIRSDNADLVPPAHVLAAHAALFHDVNVKELLISPKGLRIVVLAEEAERGRFLLFRDAEMGQTPFPRNRLQPLLHSLMALRQSLLEQAKEFQ